MTNEERDIITSFIGRVSGAQQGVGLPGSVPSLTTALPPVDREADGLIGELFAKYPDARYRLTQTAFVQEHALAEAQNRIQKLEADLRQAQQQASQAPAPSRGFLGGLFGGGQAAQQPQYQQPQPQYQQPQYQQPAPQYAPSYQPGMFQRGGGSGFLGSALTTAAGVAGGMVAGNALMNLFSGDHHSGGEFGSGFGGGGAAASPWGGADQSSGWDNQTSTPDPAGGSSGWDNVQNQPDNTGGGFDNASSGFDDSSSGFDSGSGGGFDDTSST